MQQISLYSQHVSGDVDLPVHLTNIEIKRLPIFSGHQSKQFVRVLISPLIGGVEGEGGGGRGVERRGWRVEGGGGVEGEVRLPY